MPLNPQKHPSCKQDGAQRTWKMSTLSEANVRAALKEKHKKAIRCLRFVMPGWSAALLAHHSISVVEIGEPVWVNSTVTECHMSDPYVMLKLEVKGSRREPVCALIRASRISCATWGWLTTGAPAESGATTASLWAATTLNANEPWSRRSA